jgi:uncharacterized protein with NRDE domain
MCLILFAYRVVPGLPLILAANRDEFHARPTAPMAFWDDCPAILGGRDLKEGGTWLGLDRRGRFAALTNYRDPASVNPSAPSRGHIIREFLASGQSAPGFLADLEKRASVYNGFNLIAGDREGLHWFSNRGPGAVPVPPGVHGLSNRLLDTPWPKVRLGIDRLSLLVSVPGGPDPASLFNLLESREIPPDRELPETGVGLEWERLLSPIFIAGPGYGTRSSTLLVMDDQGEIRVTERTHAGDGALQGEERRFVLKGRPWAHGPRDCGPRACGPRAAGKG